MCLLLDASVRCQESVHRQLLKAGGDVLIPSFLKKVDRLELNAKSKGNLLQLKRKAGPYPKRSGEHKEAVSKLAGEHKVHPYLFPETLCRGESCVRPNLEFNPFLGF